MRKTRIIGVWMEPWMKQALQAEADKEQRSLSSMCTVVLNRELPQLPGNHPAPTRQREGKESIGFRVTTDLMTAVESKAVAYDRSITAICYMVFDMWAKKVGART